VRVLPGNLERIKSLLSGRSPCLKEEEKITAGFLKRKGGLDGGVLLFARSGPKDCDLRKNLRKKDFFLEAGRRGSGRKEQGGRLAGQEARGITKFLKLLSPFGRLFLKNRGSRKGSDRGLVRPYRANLFEAKKVKRSSSEEGRSNC